MTNVPINLKNCDLIIKDKNGTFLTVLVGDGNLTYSEKRNLETVRNRGLLDTFREGDEEPVEATLEFRWVFLTASSGDPPTIEDVLKGQAGWVSTANDVNAPFCIDIEIQNNSPCELKEIILLSQFNYTQLAHDIKAATVSVSGLCNITKATIERAA